MFRAIFSIILKFKWPILLALILITILTGDAMFRLQIDPSTDPLFIKTSEAYRYYKEFSKQFGSDYLIAVAMSTPDLFTKDYLHQLRNLTDDIGKYPQVERVISLANTQDIRHRFLGVKMVPLLRDFFEGEHDVEEIKAQILSNELYVNNLISKDGKTATIVIYLKNVGADRESSGRFIKELRKLLKSNEKDGVKFYIAGTPVEQYDFIHYIRHDQMFFVPIITLLLILSTWLIYRNFSCMILAMSIVFMALVWTMGTISLLGQELNLVTSLLAPVVMIVSVANSVHIISYFFEMREHHPSLNEAMKRTMSQLAVPCFLTHFAAILGFLAGAISPVPAIQSFGIFAAVGTFFSYIVEVLLTPILLPILPYHQPKENKREHFFNLFLVEFLEKLEFRWQWWILLFTIVTIVLSFLGIRKLEVDTSLLKQMKSDTPLAIATRFIDNHLTGVYALGFVLSPKEGQSIASYETLRRIDEFKTYLETQPEVVKVNSITTLIKKINQARENEESEYKIPEDDGTIRLYFEGMAKAQNADLWKLITPDFRQARLEARIKAVGTREGAVMEERIRRYMAENLSGYFECHLTGNVVLLGNMAKDLVKCQMDGFGFAFGSILILIVLMFQSLSLGLLAALPNIFPILAVYGVMGYMKIELSSPTAMISSVVLGMVVDASIHFLYRFKLEFKSRHQYLPALHHTFRNVGQRLFISTFILCAGFASSSFASFKPTIYFGLLTSLAIFFALIFTIIILPVCIVIFKPFGRQRLFAKSPVELPH